MTPPTTTRDVLVAARELIAAHWSNEDGFGTFDRKGNVKACCAVGALSLALTDCKEVLVPLARTRDAVAALVECLPAPSPFFVPERMLENFSDNAGRDATVALFDRAIAKASA